MKSQNCPVCQAPNAKHFREVRSYNYFKCRKCDVLFIDTEVMDEIDNGKRIVEYSSNYWNEELHAARERSWGVALARVAEIMLYARIPVNRFIDIGSGPGYLLDALQHQLPSSDIFYAHELFPPAEEHCTKHPNYLKGGLRDFAFSFDAGLCVEVVEHLTPKMVSGLLQDLAARSVPHSIYLFNTGLVDYIEKEDLGYLDPTVRGHIVGWSLKAFQHLAGPLGFKIMAIPGKSWAFLAEYQSTFYDAGTITDRIWSANAKNIQTLNDPKTGNLMWVLGIDTARAYR